VTRSRAYAIAAILATLLHHGMRREELCGLAGRYMRSRQGVVHSRVRAKRGKIRLVPVPAMAERLIEEYLRLVAMIGRESVAPDAAGVALLHPYRRRASSLSSARKVRVRDRDQAARAFGNRLAAQVRDSMLRTNIVHAASGGRYGRTGSSTGTIRDTRAEP